MKPILIKASVTGVNLFSNHQFEVSFLNENRVFESEVEEHVVERINKANYKQNVIAIAGLNASGKTTTLRLINFILRTFINGKSLNEDMTIRELFEKNVNLQIYVVYHKSIYQLEVILKNQVDKSGQGFLQIIDEKIYEKRLLAGVSKKDLCFFKETDFLKSRKEMGEALQYIKNDDSIFPGTVFNKTQHLDAYSDNTLGTTDANYLSAVTDFELAFIQYLDSSIESLGVNDSIAQNNQLVTNSEIFYDLKFVDEEKMTISIFELNRFLSSGTIRGLGLLTRIKYILQVGGYLIIDELEIHFNKIIVQNIISFFQSDVNVNNATLIFSTHYSELLDTIDRKDEIKIVRKKGRNIELASLSWLAKAVKKNRAEYKNSDLVLSGIFETAPSYNAYWKINRILRETALEGWDEKN